MSLNKSDDNISNNNSEEKSSEKRTRNRPNKREKYKKEREELIKELEKKINIDEENRGALLYDLEKNSKLKEYLIENIENIRKIFKCGGWNYFIKKENQNEIGLLKSIFRDEDYALITKKQYETREETRKQFSCVYFIKNINLKIKKL